MNTTMNQAQCTTPRTKQSPSQKAKRESGLPRFSSRNTPLFNVYETEVKFAIELALPGLTKEDVNIDISDGRLRVSAQVQKDENTARYSRQQFDYRHFERVFTLPKSVDRQRISAEMKDGLLTISLEKRADYQPRTITVQ